MTSVKGFAQALACGKYYITVPINYHYVADVLTRSNRALQYLTVLGCFFILASPWAST